MEQVKCKKCLHEIMQINEVTFSNGTKHLERTCASCGTKNGYQQREMTTQKASEIVFEFGKYKGKKILEVAKVDPEYLTWCMATLDKKNYIRRALEVL